MNFTVTKADRYQMYGTAAILFTVALSVFATIYSLTHGIYEVFPFLYFLPLIIFIYLYPSRGVMFSLFISTIFLLLVYYYGSFNTNLIAVSTAWFVIFVTIGVVTSSFAEGLKREERKYRGIFELFVGNVMNRRSGGGNFFSRMDQFAMQPILNHHADRTNTISRLQPRRFRIEKNQHAVSLSEALRRLIRL